MGTRSTYRIIQKWNDRETKEKGQNEVCLVYLQYDGYPDGHPLETAEWLSGGRVVNGLSLGENQVVFNGVGCLAAQLISKYKDGAGGTYIYPLKFRGECGEDYLYDIIVDEENKTIEYVCYENGWGDTPTTELFRGSPQEFVQKYSNVEKES